MTVRFQFEGDAPPARDASTLLVLRDTPRGVEVFMLRRSADASFMGGAFVFPGGRVDPGDGDPSLPCDLSPDEAAARLGDDDARRALALHVTAVRECVEESGILFAREALSDAALATLRAALAGRGAPPLAQVLPPGVTLGTASLLPWDRWVTPRLEARRFDARFFVARAPESVQAASHDGSETDASAWMTPAEAIRRAEQREIVLAPPTWRVLAEVAHFRAVDALLAAAPRAPAPREPVVLSDEGEIYVALPDDPRHPEGADAPPSSFPTCFRYDHGAWVPHR